ncbi:cuticle protein CP1499 [Penaeus vannamei]|uniref:cuticle protein CP1499 n=1 Tax=Penaeus vannamei TaxID=6689 RepID=UPI00387F4224
MNSLVVLAVLGVCSAAPFIGDTPEVQAEKARFFQAFRAAQAAAAPQQAFQTVVPVQTKWMGPVAATIPAGVDGTITPVGDTAEVAAARNAFLNAYNAQVRATVGSVPVVQAPAFNAVPVVPQPTFQQTFQPTFQQAAPVQAKWMGPVAATVPAGVDGTVTPVGDTAEVAAARNAFLNAYRAQVAATVGTAPAVTTFRQAVPQQTFQPTFQQAAPVQAKWTGPVAATVPAGLPGSAPQVADTAEVAAAKQAFFSAYQRQVAAAARPF